MSKLHPAQLDSDEILELHEYHRSASRRKTMSEERRVHHTARAGYFIGLFKGNVSASDQRRVRAPHRLHSYTHAADGALTRLDIPSDDEA